MPNDQVNLRSRVHPEVKGSSKGQAEDAGEMKCRVKHEPALNTA